MTDKRSIAFICHPYHRGGVTRWMADAAMAFADCGAEVYFVTVAPTKEFFSAKGRETLLQLLEKEDSKIRVISERVGYEFEFATPEYRAYVYKKLITKVPPGTTLILSDDHAVWEAATFMHGAYPVVGVLHADEDHYYDLAEKYFRSVHLLVCVSNRVSNTMKKQIPEFPSSDIYTIPCGINLPAINNRNDPHNVLQLVYVGRVSYFQKRTGDLIKISSLLAKNNIEFHLNIIGDGDARIPLEHMVKDTGLQEYVTFSGWLSQKDVSQHLSDSDILLLTSDFEGTPIAMMEAFAAGCGMVGTRVSGIEDYEHHPLAAECLGVYTVGDIEDAVNKIKTVSAIPEVQRQQAGRKLAESEFSIGVCLEKYQNAIATIKVASASPKEIRLSFADMLYSRAIAAARYIKVVSFTR